MEEEGSAKVPIIVLNDKRQVTATVAVLNSAWSKNRDAYVTLYSSSLWELT